MACRRQTPQPGVFVSLRGSGTSQRLIAVLAAFCLLFPLALPAMSGSSSIGSSPPSSGEESAEKWPRSAWRDGDLSSLSLVDLALLANDLRPSQQNRDRLEASLAVLDDEDLYGQEHRELTRVVLEGLAKARWHQVQAMRDLSDEQWRIVASADPDAPLPDGWDGVMATVHHEELKKALLALESSRAHAFSIFESLKEEPVEPGLAATLAAETGAPLPDPLPALPAHVPEVEATAALIEQVAMASADPQEALAMRDWLAQMPPETRSALHVVFEGLVPFASGAPADAERALVELGAALEAAEDTLKIWSTASLAHQIHHVRTGPGVQIPDADSDRPPLHFGVPRLRHPDAPLPPPPRLPEAARELALALGDLETARHAEERSAPLIEALGGHQQEAVARMLFQAARYIETQHRANQVLPPTGYAENPDILETWAGFLDQGLPDPGSGEAQQLLATRPFLETQLEAALAREDLMTAIQEAVVALTPQAQQQSGPSPAPPGPSVPASSPTQEAGIDCPVQESVMELRPYLAIEPCGTDTEWDWAGQGAAFVIDVGGNDTYTGPFGRAPFDHDDFNPPTDLGIENIPLAVHLDLGGSDTYNATGYDCTLGAACGESDEGHLAGTSAGFLFEYEGGVPSVGVLVDWQTADAVVSNRFTSANESQGYARGYPVATGLLSNMGLRNPTATGLLIERVGARSDVESAYTAGDHSQGATRNGTAVGALLRLVGGRSASSANLTAGDFAQGAVDNSEPAVLGNSAVNRTGTGAFVNVAGPRAHASAHYNASRFVQGATAGPQGQGIFAAVMGPGGRSDDVYVAENNTRGFGSEGYFLDLLLPGTLEQEGLVELSPEPDVDPEVPTPPDPDDPSLPETPENPAPGINETTRPGAAAKVESRGRNSGNDDIFRLTADEERMAHGFGDGALFLNLGGNNTYEGYPGKCGDDSLFDLRGPANDCVWRQSADEGSTGPPTGIDTQALDDRDGDFFPRFLEELLVASDDHPADVHPIGRRVVIDEGSRYPFLNGTHAFVLSLTGDSRYGSAFSSSVLLDLGGNNEHFGRTAAATGPSAHTSSGTFPAAAQNLLSFTLDLDGDDFYKTATPGSLGFGAGNATGMLFDLDGNDRYNGTAYTQGVGVEGGIGVLADLSVANQSDQVNRFRADGGPNQGHGAGGGIGILVADGEHNTFEDGEREFRFRALWDQLRDLLPTLSEDPGVPPLPDQADAVAEALEAVEDLLEEQGVNEELREIRQILDGARKDLNDAQREFLNDIEDRFFDEDDNINGTDERGVQLSGGLRQSGEDGGSGASFNMGGNNPPDITQWTVEEPDQVHGIPIANPQQWVGPDDKDPPGFLRAGVPYRFTATVEDPKEDRLEVCWEFGKGAGGEGDVDRECLFSEGSGTVQVDYTWEKVHTDGRVHELRSDRPYWFNVSVTDPGGQWVARNTPVVVENRPLDVGELRGFPVVELGEPAAYQLPFATEDRKHDLPLEPDEIVTRVDWGDGSDPDEFNATAVDWAHEKWGAQIILPTALPRVPDHPTGAHFKRGDVNQITNMIDADQSAPTVFTQEGQATTLVPDAPATILVTFNGPRQIRQIALEAALGKENQGSIRLSVDGIRADGSLFPLQEGSHGNPGIIQLEETFNRTVWSLPGFPDLEGFVIRQIDTDPNVKREFQIREASAKGPGAIQKGWSLPTTFNVNYTVLDRYESHNGTITPITVIEPQIEGQANEETGSGETGSGNIGQATEENGPLKLVDIGGRGPLKHASLILRNPDYPLVVDLTDVNLGDELCIDWTGNGMATDCGTVGGDEDGDPPFRGQWQRENTWRKTGAFEVSIHHTRAGANEPEIYPLTTVDIEEGIDLRAPGAGGGTMPILFMTFNATRDTWHEGIDYPAIIDAGGNDRYIGRVAASGPPEPVYTGTLGLGARDSENEGGQFIMGAPGVPVPGLLLDGGGDDLYVSDESQTQAFATQFGVALQVDAGGDDIYVAAGEAQAAAERGGVAALISLGGNDRFNPVPIHHRLTIGASATNREPVPYGLFRTDRSIGNGPDFVQGATEDGLAILLAQGNPIESTGFFHAGARAQGYGSHLPDVRGLDQYALPMTLPECNPVSHDLPDSNPAVNWDGAFCLLGVSHVRDPRQDPGFYTNTTNPTDPNQRNPGEDSDQDLWCTIVAGPSRNPRICPSAWPNTTRLAKFLAEGPRYSPGLGVLVNSGGPAFYHAGVDAQGSAQPDARGLLLNLNGPSALLSNTQSQAFSEGGLAGTVLGEASVIRLGSEGQAFAVAKDGPGPEGLSLSTGILEDEQVPPEELPAAILLTVNRDERCESECGSGTMEALQNDPATALETLRQGSINQDIPALGTPQVDVTIDGGEPYYDIEDIVDVEVSVDPDDFDTGFGHEVTAFAVAYPGGEEEDGEWTCRGAPLAAPALIAQGHDATSFQLDLGALVAGTDPLYPAGCTEVHVFAKSAVRDGIRFGADGWGHGSDSVLLLPRPRFDIDSLEPLHTHGEPVDISITLPEPLAAQGLLRTDLKIVDQSGVEVDQLGNDLEGDHLEVTWEPEGDDDGNFSLQARFRWDESAFGVSPPLSEWIDLTKLRFEPLIPQDLVQDPLPEDPMDIVRDGPITLHGTTSGWQQDFFIRLMDDDGDVAPIRPWSKGACRGASDAVENVSGRLRGHPAGVQLWDTVLCLPSTADGYGPGDEFGIQFFSPEDDAWLDLQNQGTVQRVRFVSDTTVKRIVSPDTDARGSMADGTPNEPVKMCVVAGHGGIDLAPRDVLVTVLSLGGDDHLAVYPVTPDPTLVCPGARPGEDPDLVDSFGYRWHGPDDENLAEAGADLRYRVYALVRDGVGGVFDHNPAFDFPIDRTLPDIFGPDAVLPPDVVLPERTIPDPVNDTVRTEEQTGLKPGDTVALSVRASDTNLQRVEATVGGLQVNLSEDDTIAGLFESTLHLPQDPDDPALVDAVDEEGRLPITARAIDRAGNAKSIEAAAPLFHARSFKLDGDLQVEVRSESARLEWTLDRALDLDDPGNGMIGVLQDETGEHNLSVAHATAVPGLHRNYTVSFGGLDESTPYRVVLFLWDGAGWEITTDPILLRTLDLPFGTQVEITTDPEPTYSGEIAVRGLVTAGTADITGDLEVHLVHSASESELVSSHPSFEIIQSNQRDFSLIWDTREQVPEGVGAREVDVQVRFSDGELVWNGNITLRIDNTPPQNVTLDVVGPEPNQGWYNGTIVVGVDFDDDTPPFTRFLEVSGVTDGPVEQDSVTLEKDGVYTVNFTVHDGAQSPNDAHLEETVRVDRTLPELNATLGLEDLWTNEDEVPLGVDASDDVSGLDGVRVRAGGRPWTGWDHEMPTNVTLQGLDDGEIWIEIEARDHARNVRREAFTVVYDRTPPALVDARWVGWTQESQPRSVLHVVARDELDGEGRPSGMDAIRFAATLDGPWTDWRPMGTSGTFAINETRSGTVWVQMRDRAMNAAEPVRVEGPLVEPAGPEAEELSPEAPASALLRDLSYAPEEGGPDTPFTFLVRVHPLEHALPVRVVLHIAGESHEMKPEGPTLEGGARIYTVTVILPPTQLGSPHTFTVSATYADHEKEVETSERTGPTVLRLGTGPVATQQKEQDQEGFPVPAIPPLVIAFGLVALLAWRRKVGRPLIPSWRRNP